MDHSAPSLPSDEWATPDWLFVALSKRYGPFDLDAASTDENAKCPKHWTLKDDGLRQPWPGKVWLNPPYSRGNLDAWLAQARAHALSGHTELVCCLIPAATSEVWWRDRVMAPEGRRLRAWHSIESIGATMRCHSVRLDTEVLFLTGRVKFVGADSGARFGSAAVVFRAPVARGRGRPPKTGEVSRWTLRRRRLRASAPVKPSRLHPASVAP
mgnify:CR=1 FL=1